MNEFRRQVLSTRSYGIELRQEFHVHTLLCSSVPVFAPKVPRPEGRGASCIHCAALASGETVWRGVVVNNGPSPPACMPPFRVRNNAMCVLCLSP